MKTSRFFNNMHSGALMSLLVAAFSSSLYACDSETKRTADDIGNGRENLSRAPELINSWKGPCSKSQILDLGGYSILKFDANAFQREVYLFGDDLCENSMFLVRYEGEYTVGSGDGYAEDVYAVNFKFDRVKVIALTENGADVLDRSDFCGQEVWQKDQEIDLTASSANLGCILDDMPSLGFDVFKATDNQLQMGKMGLFPAPINGDQRPREISSEIFMRQ